jgi:hypothetical protein
MVYSRFIPLDLTEMVISWTNGNMFSMKQKAFLTEITALDEMEQSSRPKMYRNSRNQR